MAASQKKPEAQWIADERKVANLDQLDQMNSIINCLTVKSTWDNLILYHEGPSDVKESRVMDLKLCYNTFKFKEGESLTQTFASYKALMNELDFQDSLDDEEDTRSSHEYQNDLEEQYQGHFARDCYQTDCHKCGKKGHFARDCWSKTSVPSYQSPFQLKLFLSSKNEPKPRQTKEFEAKYHKVKAKLALLSSSASTSSSSSGKNKGLIVETYDWDDEEVSSDENEVTKVKALMALNDEERVSVGKESATNATDYDLAKESSVCSTPLLSLKKLDGADHVSRPKTIKSILKSKSTFKAETLKGITINEPSSAPARGKCFLAPAARKGHLTPKTKMLNSIILVKVNLPQAPDLQGLRSYDHDTHGHNRIISLRRRINLRNPQHVTKNYETYGSNVHTTSDHNDIEWFRKREILQAKNAESFKASRMIHQGKCFRYLFVAKKASFVDKVAMFSAKTEDIAASGCSIGEWFTKDCIISVTTWEDLVKKFVQKFYQLSYDNEEIEAEEDDDPDNIVDIFKIKGNLFNYETPLYKAFNDFNYLLKINRDLFTFDIQGIRTYEEYELNNTVTRDLEEPWLDNRVPYQLCDHICERNYDTSNVGNTQDNQGYEERRDDPTNEPLVCKIKRFEMLKYSFNAEEEYTAIKESEYLSNYGVLGEVYLKGTHFGA
nr:hypothetical protein [Tanacetum cinerariifolium]